MSFSCLGDTLAWNSLTIFVKMIVFTWTTLT